MEFQTANLIPSNANPGPFDTGKFKLRAVSPSDIWRKPPNLDNFTAPIIYKALPISTFKSARVTAKGPWKTLYDQGGLFLVLPPKTGGSQKPWVKSGIEFYQGKPMMSVVAADQWADWSLLPLSRESEEQGSMTVEFEREKEEDGSWVCNSPKALQSSFRRIHENVFLILLSQAPVGILKQMGKLVNFPEWYDIVDQAILTPISSRERY